MSSSSLRLVHTWYLLGTVHLLTSDIQGSWLAEGVDSNTKFADIDLTEGEWFDYDEKANDEVSIKELKWEINRA